MQTATGSGASLARESGEALIGTRNPSLMDALFPSLTTLQRALLALAAVVVLAVCGKLHFYLPDNPVPITFQTAGVLLMGGFLGLRWGITCHRCLLSARNGGCAYVCQQGTGVGHHQRAECRYRRHVVAT